MHKASAATPRLYHAPSSYYSMIARLALAEGGIAYEPVFMEIHVRMSQQHPKPVVIVGFSSLILAVSTVAPAGRLGGVTERA
jgi:hypothetical protein